MEKKFDISKDEKKYLKKLAKRKALEKIGRSSYECVGEIYPEMLDEMLHPALHEKDKVSKKVYKIVNNPDYLVSTKPLNLSCGTTSISLKHRLLDILHKIDDQKDKEIHNTKWHGTKGSLFEIKFFVDDAKTVENIKEIESLPIDEPSTYEYPIVKVTKLGKISSNNIDNKPYEHIEKPEKEQELTFALETEDHILIFYPKDFTAT